MRCLVSLNYAFVQPRNELVLFLFLFLIHVDYTAETMKNIHYIFCAANYQKILAIFVCAMIINCYNQLSLDLEETSVTFAKLK